MTFEVFWSCNLYLFFLIFCIKNKWQLHTTYPKREVPLKEPKSLFWEHPKFCNLSQVVKCNFPQKKINLWRTDWKTTNLRHHGWMWTIRKDRKREGMLSCEHSILLFSGFHVKGLVAWWCVYVFLGWGVCVCVSLFSYFYFFWESPPTIGFILGVIGHLFF